MRELEYKLLELSIDPAPSIVPYYMDSRKVFAPAVPVLAED